MVKINKFKQYEKNLKEIWEVQKEKTNYEASTAFEKLLQIYSLGLGFSVIFVSFFIVGSQKLPDFSIPIGILLSSVSMAVFVGLLYVIINSILKIEEYKFSLNFFKKNSRFNKLVQKNKPIEALKESSETLEPMLIKELSNDISLINYIEDEKCKIKLLKLTPNYLNLLKEISEADKLYNEINQLYVKDVFTDKEKIILDTLYKIKMLNMDKEKDSSVILHTIILKDDIENFNLIIQTLLNLLKLQVDKSNYKTSQLFQQFVTSDIYLKVKNLNEQISNIFQNEAKNLTMPKVEEIKEQIEITYQVVN